MGTHTHTHTQHNTTEHSARTHTHIAFFAVRQEARKPLFWQSQFALQAPYGEYFCCLSCPSTLPTVLIVLVWFGCVSVLRIARTKLKIAFFAVRQETYLAWYTVMYHCTFDVLLYTIIQHIYFCV